MNQRRPSARSCLQSLDCVTWDRAARHTVAELLFYSEDWAGKCFGNVEMLAGRFGGS